MGEAGLTIHTLAGSDEMYDWYGYYATPRSEAEQDVPLPVRDAVTVQKFAEVFSLSRTVSGLSILVPYLREGVDLDSLARAAIEQYFLPILSGRLEVVVRDGAREIVISRSSIRDAVAEISWPQRRTKEELFALLDLAQWQISLESGNYALLETAGTERQYSLDPILFPPESLQRMTDDFASGRRVAIRIPIRVRPKQGEAATEEVRVVLERDERLRVRSDVPHLRSGINISKMRETGPAGVRGLLVVGFDSEARQGELDKLLQASEGPAHVNWEQRGDGYDKARLLYEDAHKVIGFVRHLVRNLVELLITPADVRDTRTLAAFFPDPAHDGNSNHRKKQPDPKQSPPAGVIEGIVRAIFPGLGGLRPVEAAELVLSQPGTMKTTKTGADGRYRFEGLGPTEYEIDAQRSGFGRATTTVTLPPEHGMRVDLFLRREAPQKMFFKVPLQDGFGIRGNEEFLGNLRPVRVKMAYAGWGGSKSFTEADFSLNDKTLEISFSGVQETERQHLVDGPNLLRFTPVTNQFYVEVKGFDQNRALYVEARALDDDRGGEDEGL